MKTYQGTNLNPGDKCGPVTVDGLPLNQRADLEPSFPVGANTFDWGYKGSGPKRLAIALIADATGDDQEALDHFKAFAEDTVAMLPSVGAWRLTDEHIRQKLARLKAGIRPYA